MVWRVCEKDKYEHRERVYDSLKGIAIIGIILVHMELWNNISNSNDILHRVFLSGALGVELTYIINAYFYSKLLLKKGSECFFPFIIKRIIRLIPVYYFAMTINFFAKAYFCGSLEESTLNIIAHYLFLNFLSPYWFNSCFGGSGYVGTLVLMWIVWYAYIKTIKNTLSAIVNGIFITSVSLVISIILGMFFERIVSPENLELYNTWLWYLKRGVYSFALGTIVYYIKEQKWVFKKRDRILINMGCFLYLIKGCLSSDRISGFEAALVFAIIVWVNSYNTCVLLDNALFAWVGRYSMEIFVLHILLYNCLVSYSEVLKPGLFGCVVLVFCSFALAIPLKFLVHKPLAKLMKARFERI